jgi:2-oxoglutarate ferredoxin oxidoreductase subunit alpha
VILLESKWATGPGPGDPRASTPRRWLSSATRGYEVNELPIEQACLEFTSNPRLGKNMFVLGML